MLLTWDDFIRALTAYRDTEFTELRSHANAEGESWLTPLVAAYCSKACYFTAWRHSPHGKESKRRAQQRYLASEKGRAATARSQERAKREEGSGVKTARR
jgi:hypothetical protein